MTSLDKHFWEERTIGLAELHNHVGAGVKPSVLWSIAHEQGFRLPTKDYWKFVDLVTIKKRHNHLNEYEQAYRLPELIQSSPLAIERSVYEIVGGAYRRSNVTVHELRYNPMLRNRGGEQDLDHIITASLRGLERTLLEYPHIKAGLILMLHRPFPFEYNEIVIRKAIQYSYERSIVGVDIAGPRTNNKHDYKEYAPLLDKARQAGLGITVHVGEEGGSTEEMWEAVTTIKPDRIGHGILAATDSKLMAVLAKEKIVLELCPTSNLHTGSVSKIEDFKKIVRTFIDNGVRFCINTDGAALNQTSIRQEMTLLFENNIMSEIELKQANQTAIDATFIKEG